MFKKTEIEHYIDSNHIPNILLVGNGISMAAGRDVSWKNMIKDVLNKHTNISYDEICELPGNMQILAATKNNIKYEMKIIAKSYYDTDCVDSTFLKALALSDLDSILTTNYDYDFEYSLGIKQGITSFRNCRKWTKDINENTVAKKFNLFQYSDVLVNGKCMPIWHIHGDITSPSNIIMGHRYYGKLLHYIQQYLPSFYSRYSTDQKLNKSYNPKSWVDYFFLSNVYIIGLGMYPTETDLWWLLDIKQERFSNTKVYYYSKDSLLTDKSRKVLLETLKVNIIDNLDYSSIAEKNDYKAFYIAAINDVRQKIQGGQKDDGL